MEGARPRTQEGYVEDVACAVAAVLRRRPVMSAIALVAAAETVMAEWIWLPPMLLFAGIPSALFLAGALLAGGRRPARWTWIAGYGVGAALAVAAAVSAFDYRLSIHWAVQQERTETLTAKIAVLGLACFLGFGVRSAISGAFAAALLAITLAPSGLLSMSPSSFDADPDRPALYAGWFAMVAMLFLARHGKWIGALPFVAAALIWRQLEESRFPDLGRIGPGEAAAMVEVVILAAASAVLPVIAGRAAAALGRDERADFATRLVVRAQRDAWRTALVALIAGAALFVDGEPSPESLLVIVAGMVFLAQCARPGTFGALAPWVAAAALSVLLSISMCWRLRIFEFNLEQEALIVLYVPLVVGAVVGRARTDRWPWWGWIGFVIAAAVVFVDYGQTVNPVFWTPDGGVMRVSIWCVVVSLIVHAIAMSDTPARHVIAISPIASMLALGILNETLLLEHGWRVLRPEFVAPTLASGFVAALLGLAARRIRSMTALPDDHASFELAALRASSLAPAPNP